MTPDQDRTSGETMQTRVVHVLTTATTLLFLSDHIKVMKGIGVEYHVIGNFDGTDHEADGVTFHHAPLHRGFGSFGDVVGFVRIVRLLRQVRPETVIVSTPKAGLVGGLAAFLFARKAQLIFLVRGFRFPTLAGRKRWLVKSLELLPSYFADRVLVTSQQTAEALRELLPKRFWRRIGVTLNGTANGIDTQHRFTPDNPALAPVENVRDRFGIAQDAFVILIVARVCVDKGFADLIDAFERVQAKHPRAVLLIVGDDDPSDPLPPTVLGRLNELSVRANSVSNAQIPEIYRAADILACPSHREGFGISAIEAAAMGTPTVASRVGGLQSAVREDVSGLFHPVSDVDGMVQRYCNLIEEPTKLNALRRTGRAYVVDKFDSRLYDRFWLDLFLGRSD